MRARLLTLLVSAGFLLSCGERSVDTEPCTPAGDSLSYENFGRPFFEANCVTCHGGLHGQSSRAFNTVELIRAQRERIFSNATGENPPMPPGPDDPSAQDRVKLEQWLVCGAR